jgi:LysM repeat protein
MKILQIFGAVIAVHLLAFIFIFATPGCQSKPANRPTPDATVPTAGAPMHSPGDSLTYTPAPVDTGAMSTYTPPTEAGRAEPTRPGSPNAAALAPARPVVDDVAPVSTYSVQRGDSLWSIAKKHKITVAELAKANNLSTGATLRPGQKLMVPTKAAAPKDLATTAATPEKAPAPATTSRPASGETMRHTVQSGESLGTIARKYQVTVGEIAAANNITDPAKIRAGQQLVIPGFRAVSNRTPAASTAASTPAPTTPPPATTTTAPTESASTNTVPRFEIAPPPPGQDLDAGLKDTATEVPTIKVEEPRPKG